MKYAKYGFGVLTLALAMGLTTKPAAAQQAFTGHFTLETEAYWGAKLLPPGEYSILANLDPTSLIREVRVTGDGVRASVLTANTLGEPVSDHSKLRIEQINGVNVIRQLDAGLVGQSFRFGVSKNARVNAEQASVSSQKQLTVPVST